MANRTQQILDEIEALPPGRELDARVAEEVMGYVWRRPGTRDTHLKALIPPEEATVWVEEFHSWHLLDGKETVALDYARYVPRFSTDTLAAMSVVEYLGSLGWRALIKSPWTPSDPWHAGFTPQGATGWNGRADYRGFGETFALAVCRAALVAKTGILSP